MPKKSPAPEFNMSETIRDFLTKKPNLTSKEATEAILARYPGANAGFSCSR